MKMLPARVATRLSVWHQISIRPMWKVWLAGWGLLGIALSIPDVLQLFPRWRQNPPQIPGVPDMPWAWWIVGSLVVLLLATLEGSYRLITEKDSSIRAQPMEMESRLARDRKPKLSIEAVTVELEPPLGDGYPVRMIRAVVRNLSSDQAMIGVAASLSNVSGTSAREARLEVTHSRGDIQQRDRVTIGPGGQERFDLVVESYCEGKATHQHRSVAYAAHDLRGVEIFEPDSTAKLSVWAENSSPVSRLVRFSYQGAMVLGELVAEPSSELAALPSAGPSLPARSSEDEAKQA